MARNGRHELTTMVLTRAQVGELVERTLHANSARESLVKMCTLPLLASETAAIE